MRWCAIYGLTVAAIARWHEIDGLNRGNWCRAKVYSDSPWMREVEDIQEQKQLEWTGAMNRTSIVALDRSSAQDTVVPMILDCESWTYYFTPDVRYGSEPLYQAFQFHRHHLFRATLDVKGNLY